MLLLKLQSGKQVKLNEQVPVHPEIRSGVIQRKHRPEAYDLERQCQETVPEWHSVREGGDIVTHAGQC